MLIGVALYYGIHSRLKSHGRKPQTDLAGDSAGTQTELGFSIVDKASAVVDLISWCSAGIDSWLMNGSTQVTQRPWPWRNRYRFSPLPCLTEH